MEKGSKKMGENKQWIIAHRGASGLVEHENTIEAFEKAIEVGSDSIECDIRKTKDGKIIVVHNPDYNNKLISEYTYEELCEETKKDGFIMPLYEDALECVKGRIFIDVELKEAGYEEEVVEVTLKHLTPTEFFFRSFIGPAIKRIKEINPDIKTVLLVGAEKPRFGFFSRLAEIYPYHSVKKYDADMVSPHYLLVRWGFTKRLHRHKVPVLVWTVNEEDIMDKLLNKEKVDAIITNYPDKALTLRK